MIVLCVLVVLVFGLGMVAVEQVRESAHRTTNAQNLKLVGLAHLNYHESAQHLPPAVTKNKKGEILNSWRLEIAPFFESTPLDFRLEEPWDSKHHTQIQDYMPLCFRTPWFYESKSKTLRQVFVGPGTAFEREGITLNDLSDGTGQTILVTEGREPVLWLEPKDLKYHPEQELPLLGAEREYRDIFGIPNVKRAPLGAGFADGTVRYFSRDVDEGFLRLMITRNDGVDLREELERR